MSVAVNIPAPQPRPPAHGLLASATQVQPPDSRWEQGFAFSVEGCDQPESWAIPCLGGAAVGPGAFITENRGSQDGIVTWYPIVTRASYKCDAQQAADEDFRAVAQRIFNLGESKLLESELWRGDAVGAAAGGDNISLAGGQGVGPGQSPNYVNHGTGGGAAPGIGLRVLVQAAAGTTGGQVGMIHATPDVATAWVQSGALYRGQGQLRTIVGDHIVVAGTGYDGSGPGLVDPAGTLQYAYITSPVHVLLGEVEVLGQRATEGVNRGSNDWEVIVQRTGIAYFDGCLHAGVAIDAMGTSL